LDPVEATQHRHNVARGTFGATDDGPLPIPAPRFSNTPTSFRPSAGANGSATTTILQEIGLSEKEIRSAFQSGVVAGDGFEQRAL
jgi:alpha-methylacyl-CoA racemase